tara:strand:- start:850 stop:1359 length:510 start_codon:yes stop_codon:yes gene_type:complete
MKALDPIIRYALTLVLTIYHSVFYTVFAPLTVYITYYMLTIFTNPALTETTITFNSHSFTFIPACTAALAYLILTILIFTTKNIKLLIRLKMILVGFISILALNIARILILMLIYNNFGEAAFNTVHLLFWHILSTLFVILIWLALIKIYKIKAIPIYSDLKYLIKKLK